MSKFIKTIISIFVLLSLFVVFAIILFVGEKRNSSEIQEYLIALQIQNTLLSDVIVDSSSDITSVNGRTNINKSNVVQRTIISIHDGEYFWEGWKGQELIAFPPLYDPVQKEIVTVYISRLYSMQS